MVVRVYSEINSYIENKIYYSKMKYLYCNIIAIIYYFVLFLSFLLDCSTISNLMYLTKQCADDGILISDTSIFNMVLRFIYHSLVYRTIYRIVIYT